jgi:hypothetical protein
MPKIDKLGTSIRINKEAKMPEIKLSDKLREITEAMKDDINNKIFDVGYFSNFAQDCKNPDKNVFARAISLAVRKDPNTDGKAYLSINILHPTMQINSSSNLAYGDRKKLLEFINKPEFVDNLESVVRNMSEKMKEVR